MDLSNYKWTDKQSNAMDVPGFAEYDGAPINQYRVKDLKGEGNRDN